METVKIKKFIDMGFMAEKLKGILMDSRDGVLDDTNREFVCNEYSDEVIENRAWEMAEEFNREMGEYLNAKDHKIFGNMNNVDYDYPLHIEGEVKYNHELVQSMIDRLNAEEKSKQADEDREWLVEWFFETFGTFGIGYNFTDEIMEALYDEFND